MPISTSALGGCCKSSTRVEVLIKISPRGSSRFKSYPKKNRKTPPRLTTKTWSTRRFHSMASPTCHACFSPATLFASSFPPIVLCNEACHEDLVQQHHRYRSPRRRSTRRSHPNRPGSLERNRARQPLRR